MITRYPTGGLLPTPESPLRASYGRLRGILWCGVRRLGSAAMTVGRLRSATDTLRLFEQAVRSGEGLPSFPLPAQASTLPMSKTN